MVANGSASSELAYYSTCLRAINIPLSVSHSHLPCAWITVQKIQGVRDSFFPVLTSMNHAVVIGGRKTIYDPIGVLEVEEMEGG